MTRKSLSHAVNCRKSCALVRRGCREAKRSTWENFLNSMNPLTNLRVLCNKDRKKTSSRAIGLHTIYQNNQILIHPKGIGEAFAGNSFSPQIIQEKNKLNIDFLNSQTNEILSLIEPISLTDLQCFKKNPKDQHQVWIKSHTR